MNEVLSLENKTGLKNENTSPKEMSPFVDTWCMIAAQNNYNASCNINVHDQHNNITHNSY